MRKVLVINPHCDDGELGAGGTIAKWIEAGDHVVYVSLTTEDPEETGHVRQQELMLAAAELGIAKSDIIWGTYPIRRLPEFRQEILDTFLELKMKIQPNVVIVPSLNQRHQDHEVVAQEAFRAFRKDATILGTILPWNCIIMEPGMFVALEQRHIDKKIAATKHYKSQAEKSYMSEEAIRSMAIAHGLSIDQPYAEAFEIIRWIA